MFIDFGSLKNVLSDEATIIETPNSPIASGPMPSTDRKGVYGEGGGIGRKERKVLVIRRVGACSVS